MDLIHLALVVKLVSISNHLAFEYLYQVYQIFACLSPADDYIE